MASRVLLHLLLAGVLFHVTAAGECLSYMTSGGTYYPSKSCNYPQSCCGTCENRYCCLFGSNHLSQTAQLTCSVKTIGNAALGLTIAGIAIVLVVIITCCCCCCSCCGQSPRPMVGTTTTTVVNTQCTMQPPMVQGGQYPAYQPLLSYAGQPMPAGHYQTQPYVAGPPPPYHTVAGPDQPSYPIQAAAQEGYAHQPQTDALNQPAYNPAYKQMPNCGY